MAITNSDVTEYRDLPSSIHEVQSYALPSVVQRYQMKLGLGEEAALQLFEDTKLFLFLCAKSRAPLSPNEILDFGWHEFLLFTQDYAAFCKEHFGFFIHHRPHKPGDESAHGEGWERTRNMAKLVFEGQLSSNWGVPSFSGNSVPSCDNCGCQPADCSAS